MIDWLYVVLWPTKIPLMYMHRDITIAGDKLQYLVLCYVPLAFEQEGMLSCMPHLLWQRTSVFVVSPEGPLIVVLSEYI